MMSWIDSRHWTISTGWYFQNGHRNIAKNQHCPISSQLMSRINSGHHYLPTYQIVMISDNVDFLRYCGGHFENINQLKLFNVGNQFRTSLSTHTSQFNMWVDNDVPNWFPTLNNFYWSPFSKWPPQYRKNSTLSDIITIWYVMIPNNVVFLRYCGGHFENINQLKLFNVGNQFRTSLSTHISNCDDIGQCWIFAILWWPYFQNGHHNIGKNQHCPISSQFDMWVDNDVPNWFPTLNNFLHYLPTYQIVMISDNVEFLRYCGDHFENGDR
jgi:uncharacterized protein Usg